MTTLESPPLPVSLEQRRAVLANVVGVEVRRGWRVESQTDYQVTFIRGHRPNHILHLLLTIITLGLWVVVWILVALTSKEVRTVVTVDEYGQPFEVGEGPYQAPHSRKAADWWR